MRGPDGTCPPPAGLPRVGRRPAASRPGPPRPPPSARSSRVAPRWPAPGGPRLVCMGHRNSALYARRNAPGSPGPGRPPPATPPAPGGPRAVGGGPARCGRARRPGSSGPAARRPQPPKSRPRAVRRRRVTPAGSAIRTCAVPGPCCRQCRARKPGARRGGVTVCSPSPQTALGVEPTAQEIGCSLASAVETNFHNEHFLLVRH